MELQNGFLFVPNMSQLSKSEPVYPNSILMQEPKDMARRPDTRPATRRATRAGPHRAAAPRANGPNEAAQFGQYSVPAAVIDRHGMRQGSIVGSVGPLHWPGGNGRTQVLARASRTVPRARTSLDRQRAILGRVSESGPGGHSGEPG